jgi:hypothetical protein
MMRARVAFAVLILVAFPLGGAAALEAPESIRATWGVLAEALLDSSVDSEISSPSFNFHLGFGATMPFSAESPFSFEPSASFHSSYCEYLNNRAVPTDQTFGSAYELGILLDAPVVFTVPLDDSFSFGIGVGACFDIRYAFTIDSSYHANDTPWINSYYWEQGRFFTPSTLIRGEYMLSERFSLGLEGRALWPIYNLWTDEGYGFLDRAKFLAGISIRYKLPKAKE